MMSFLDSRRIPAPEDELEREESGLSADPVADVYRVHLDDQCVDHAIRLGMHQGIVLDLGTGTGRVAIELARRCPEVTILGIDRSPDKIGNAIGVVEEQGLQGRLHFQVADPRRIRFKTEYFDGVLCNGLLHQINDPVSLLNGIARIVKRDGAVLVRDLRRPSLMSSWWHRHWFGRKYPGAIRQHYLRDLQSSYSYSEWRKHLQGSALHDSAQIFVQGLSHIGIERSAKNSLFAAQAALKARREFLVETEGWRKDA